MLKMWAVVEGVSDTYHVRSVSHDKRVGAQLATLRLAELAWKCAVLFTVLPQNSSAE